MTEEIIDTFPKSGQKKVYKILHQEYGICIKKEQLNLETSF